MVKMSLDHVQAMAGQVTETKAATSANGESSRGSWEEKECERHDLGLTTTPKPVSLEKTSRVQIRSARFPGSSGVRPFS